MRDLAESGASTVFRGYRPAATLLILIVAFCFVPRLADAHIPSTGATVGFRFPVLVVGSAVVGSFGGFGVVVAQVRGSSTWLGRQEFTGVIGIGLSVLGIFLLLPLVASNPTLAFGSIALGFLGASGLSVRLGRADDRTVALSTTGALSVHQFVEGMALAGAYITGGVIGVTAAVFLTLHTVAETAVVAGAHISATDTHGAIGAVVLMQGIYVIAAGITYAIAWSVPVLAQDIAAAGAAVVLMAAGIHECWSVIDRTIY